ncbi:MAG TPA: YfbU family protein [Tepidisphaeraceae bacterium]|nr:YfbU family protein [Tepidisphaeraceae bacterium]
MPRMKLDIKDRLILVNQCRILRALYPDEAGYYSKAETVFSRGYELNYGWVSEFVDPEPMDEKECREVHDILSMFRALGDSYNQLADKSGIEEREVRFLGFDGNNEGRQLGYADFIINQEGGYQESKVGVAGDGLNSHMPTLDTYRRMLKVWKPLKEKYTLKKADIEKIVAERIHPENRKKPKS